MAYESITDECVVYRVAKQLLGISTEEPRRWDKNALRHVSAYEVLRALEAAYRAGAASEYRRTEVRSRGFEPVIGKVTEYVGPVPIDLPEGKLRIIGILPKAMLVEEEGRSLDQVPVVTDDRLLSLLGGPTRWDRALVAVVADHGVEPLQEVFPRLSDLAGCEMRTR